MAAIGDLKIRLHAAEALPDIGGSAIDTGCAEPTLETVSEASIRPASPRS